DSLDSVRRASDILCRIQRRRDRLLISTLQKSAQLGAKTQLNLRSGPQKSAERRSQQAATRHALWRELSADLWQKKPRWTLQDQAEYIQELFHNKGQNFSVRTILDSIKGVRSELLPKLSP